MYRLSFPVLLTGVLCAQTAVSQDLTYTLNGMPGLIEMPTAQAAPDGQITANASAFRQQQRANINFQMTPRLSGTFRYTVTPDATGTNTAATFGPSLDLRYRFMSEGRFGSWTPAMAIGVQNILGANVDGSEYIVASKSLSQTIIATAGLGWGRLGSEGGFSDLFGARPADTTTRDGALATGQFFKGDAAFFGGISWQYSSKITVKAEYSSDAFTRETANGTFVGNAPVNVGLTYHWKPSVTFDVAYLNGAEAAASVTYALNPRKRALVSGVETAPVPVRVRGQDRAVLASWDVTSDTPLVQTVQAGLERDGIRLNTLSITGDTARVQYTNGKFRSEAQALGRVARVLSQTLPDNVSRITLEPTQSGMALSATTLARTDIEMLENTPDAAADLLARATVSDATRADDMTVTVPNPTPFTWGIIPYAAVITGSGNTQLDAGLDVFSRYEIAPSLSVQGTLRQSALGQRTVAPNTDVPNGYQNVRTDRPRYGADGAPVIADLTVTHFSRPATNVYGRISAGYLEKMYGGLSTELLWKPVDSRLAFGAELNYAQQRDFDMLFGFQDYNIVTGYLSAYYSFDNGVHAKIDAGRYLAGDWGATITMDRAFDNGWKIGAYVTMTDMSYAAFGEGSFDKGVIVTVPTDFFFGNASRRNLSAQLGSPNRDGGARLEIDDRLYDIVRDGHVAGPLGDTWGRVWR